MCCLTASIFDGDIIFSSSYDSVVEQKALSNQLERKCGGFDNSSCHYAVCTSPEFMVSHSSLMESEVCTCTFNFQTAMTSNILL